MKNILNFNLIIGILILILFSGLLYSFNYRNSIKSQKNLTTFTYLPIGELTPLKEFKSKYAIDSENAYYDKRIINADPNTLEVMRGNLEPMMGYYITYKYAKDFNNVYYEGRLIQGAAPNKFQLIENGPSSHNYATDGNYIYFKDKIIPESDPKTFKILWQNIWEGCGQTEYSKDKKNVYLEDKLVTGADSETFESLINGFGRDKRGYYKGLEYIGVNLDPKELECNYG